jgi:hypothetical protein
VNILNILYLLLTTKFILIFSCFLFSCVFITYNHHYIWAMCWVNSRHYYYAPKCHWHHMACRKCKFRCSLQLNCMKQIMKWLLETLIFIKLSPQSIYGKYFIIKKFFFANITFVDPVNGNIEISGVSLACNLRFLFLKYLFSINHWEIVSSGFPFENRCQIL